MMFKIKNSEKFGITDLLPQKNIKEQKFLKICFPLFHVEHFFPNIPRIPMYYEKSHKFQGQSMEQFGLMLTKSKK